MTCDSSRAPDMEISRAELETEISRVLAAQTGRSPDAVWCEGALVNSVGANQTGAVQAGGIWLPIKVVIGSDRGLHVVVGRTPVPRPR